MDTANLFCTGNMISPKDCAEQSSQVKETLQIYQKMYTAVLPLRFKMICYCSQCTFTQTYHGREQQNTPKPLNNWSFYTKDQHKNCRSYQDPNMKIKEENIHTNHNTFKLPTSDSLL
jgi:hypothetical protein